MEDKIVVVMLLILLSAAIAVSHVGQVSRNIAERDVVGWWRLDKIKVELVYEEKDEQVEKQRRP